MNKLICILGKSAAGKSTVEKLLEEKSFNRIISYTTRPIRENEKQGIDYNYITEEEFKNMEEDNQLIENTTYRNWRYGINKNSILKDKYNICVIEPHGYRQIKGNYDGEVIGIYLNVEDKERLLRSLNREVKPDIDEIVRRYISDKELFKDIEKEVDLVVDNWYTYETVKKIIKFINEYDALNLDNFYK